MDVKILAISIVKGYLDKPLQRRRTCEVGICGFIDSPNIRSIDMIPSIKHLMDLERGSVDFETFSSSLCLRNSQSVQSRRLCFFADIQEVLQYHVSDIEDILSQITKQREEFEGFISFLVEKCGFDPHDDLPIRVSIGSGRGDVCQSRPDEQGLQWLFHVCIELLPFMRRDGSNKKATLSKYHMAALSECVRASFYRVVEKAGNGDLDALCLTMSCGVVKPIFITWDGILSKKRRRYEFSSSSPWSGKR